MGQAGLARDTYLIVGLGSLGRQILLDVSRLPGPTRVVVATRSIERAARLANLARLTAAVASRDVRIELRAVDLRRAGALAAVVRDVNPAIVIHSAAHLTWWLPDLFPEPAAGALRRLGFGVWLPLHLDLAVRLMEELHAAAYSGFSLVGSYPDTVNPILARVGRAPTAGFGNIDEVVAKIRAVASLRYGCAMDAIRVTIVGHHALSVSAFGGDGPVPPYRLEVWAGDTRVADEDAAAMMLGDVALPPNPSTHLVTAASAVQLAVALGSPVARVCYVSGPLGRAGGYTALVSSNGIDLCRCDGMTLEDADRLNLESQKFDGIQEIEADGTVTFLPDHVRMTRELFGYECPRLPVADVSDRAQELLAKFAEFGRVHGVDITRHREQWWGA